MEDNIYWLSDKGICSLSEYGDEPYFVVSQEQYNDLMDVCKTKPKGKKKKKGISARSMRKRMHRGFTGYNSDKK